MSPPQTDRPPIDWDVLRAAAQMVATKSYSPYSNFPVGAAALVVDGTIVVGTNVENASYVAGICAETALVGTFVAGGGTRGDLVALAVTDPAGTLLMPCGRCRQLVHEFGGDDLPVNGRRLGDLLPEAFGPGDLEPRGID